MQGVGAEAQPVLLWKRQYYVGVHSIPVENLVQCVGTFRVRKISYQHVQKLIEEFQRTGQINDKVSVVAYEYKGDPNDVDAILAHEPKMVFEGAHTTEAVRRLKDIFPRNSLYCDYRVKVYWCRGTEEDRENLRALGVMSNIQNENYLPLTFVQKVQMMHSVHEREA